METSLKGSLGHLVLRKSNMLIFFVEKIEMSFCSAKAPHIFSAKMAVFCKKYVWKCNVLLTNDVISFDSPLVLNNCALI